MPIFYFMNKIQEKYMICMYVLKSQFTIKGKRIKNWKVPFRSGVPKPQPTTGPRRVWNWAVQADGTLALVCVAPLAQAVGACTGTCSFICVSSRHFEWQVLMLAHEALLAPAACTN